MNAAIKCIDRRIARLCDKIDNRKRKIAQVLTDLNLRTLNALLRTIDFISLLMVIVADVVVYTH